MEIVSPTAVCVEHSQVSCGRMHNLSDEHGKDDLGFPLEKPGLKRTF